MWILITFIVALVVVLLLNNNQRLRWIYILIRNLPRDIRTTIKLLKIHMLSKKCLKEKTTLSKQFNILVKQHPQKVAIYFEHQAWTYEMMEQLANKITRYFMSLKLNHGDIIALMLDNSPEYHCIILGLSRLGIVTSLINTNLMKKPLLHSITLTKPKAVIFGSNHDKAINEIIEDLQDIKLYYFHKTEVKNNILSIGIDLRKILLTVSDEQVQDQLPDISPDNPVLYIFTSGTTGLPKASVLTHTRYIVMTLGLATALNLTKDDIVYSPLPLYHAGGTVAGVGQAIVFGASTVIRTKFSASEYIKDCIKYKVTVGQYIGEMCRYILAAYGEKEPEKHQIRVMFGNGLSPLIWKKFVEKFNIRNILEVYGSTEGIASLVNFDNKIGSVGYIPLFLRLLDFILLIKCDENGEPIRNKDGRCIKCNVNEPGLIIGKVNPNNALFNYKGYTDSVASKKKIVQDVVTKGDMFFNSGDVLVYDEYGYFYFKDRLGDTFRWKGENVSTFEVESVISNILNLSDVTVYGVTIPQTDGRAGMASIVDTDKLIDIQSLGNALKLNLPSYAVPIFIRILDSPSLTSTFKLKKTELREEGYNINTVKDLIYFFDTKEKNYVPLDKQIYDNILYCKLRL